MTESRTASTSRQLDPRMLVVTVIAPLVLALAGIAAQLAWLPDLPDPIAMHWGPNGRPDGFAPFWTAPALVCSVGVVFAVGFGVIIARSGGAGVSFAQKIIAISVLGATAMVTIGVTGSLALQRGLTDASPATGFGPVLVIAIAAAILLAVAAWFFLPTTTRVVVEAAAAPTLALKTGEHAVWVGVAQFRTGAMLALGGTVALVVAAVTYAVALAGIWPVAIAPVILALLVVSTATWRVRVDANGLDIRGLLGWPHLRATLDNIESAGTIDVRALGEFGGFGLRFASTRRVGVITRSGEALEVKRRDGSSVVVTVDDAATAAALVEALATARRPA